MIRNNLPGPILDPAHPLTRGLVGWWLMNEGAGSAARDISRYANNGRLTGVTQSATSGWTGYRFGGAVRFDGVDDMVTIPHSSSLALTKEFSVSCWLIVASVGSGVTAVNKGWVDPGYVAPFLINYMPNGQLQWYTGNGTNHEGVFVANCSLGRLYHVVGVHTGGSAAGAKNLIYVDGALGMSATTVLSVADAGTAMGIGRNGSGALYPFSGVISNVRVYNRALSADEVRMLYSQPLAGLITQASHPARHFIFSAAAPAVPPHPITSDRLHNRGGNWGRIWRRGETT